MADHNWNESGAALDAPLPPPPPPPPPPSQGRLEDGNKQKKRLIQSLNPTSKAKKRTDFREILTLFHDESMDIDQIQKIWSSLYQTTLVESQEDHKKHRQQEQHGLKRKKPGKPNDHGPLSTRGLGGVSRHGNLSQDHYKRARQSSTISLDSSESGKTSRLGNRFPKNITKASKLLQKFGGRT
ncbi:hypothetical protein DD238_003591 [Peronospora effusa]|uniref:FH2 domain-containing protein n=1 Tax=Peronospora effusa TaxID=542832 RepID=A0A3M6V7I0_9STRA|nr:hypothetical protein DD238_003591 [Peronospora effusa]